MNILLLAKMRQRVAQGLAGDGKDPSERGVQIQDDKDRRANRKRSKRDHYIG